MNDYTEMMKDESVARARESFSGRLLSDRQFAEAMRIIEINRDEIARSGAFKDKHGDYAYAYARSERFDVAKADTILRDLFKERCGETMNQMRERYADQLENLTEKQRQSGYNYASDVGVIMENGIKITFNRAVGQQAQKMGSDLGITDNAARTIMAEEFEAVENQSFWEWGKELDERIYRPQIDAEKAERETSQSREQGNVRDYGRSSARSRDARTQRTRSRGPEMRR